MIDNELRRLRTEAQRLAHGKHPSQVRYPETFRRAAVALVRSRVAQGGSVAKVARAVGVSEPTLGKWLRPATLPVLRPVAVTATTMPAPQAPHRPVVITPNGIRVKGLDPDTLIAVLRALG
jgi:transposase-like protein